MMQLHNMNALSTYPEVVLQSEKLNNKCSTYGAQ